MSSTSEKSHATNVTNLESLIASITAFGASYNPSRESIQKVVLQAILAASKDSLRILNDATSANSMAINAREVAFQSLSKRITRANNFLKASETTVQVDESARTIVRKLQGKRASAKLTDEEKIALEAEGKDVNQISTSQMSYDSQLDNFDKFISLLATVPQYKPNEEDLTEEALRSFHNELKEMNTNVLTTDIEASNARDARNEILYKPLVGLVDVASDTKTYIKAVFGTTSTQYKQISKLSFVSRN